MKFIATLAAAAAFAMPAAAFAQDAHAGHEGHQEAAKPVTEAEVSQFVAIALQGKALSEQEGMDEAGMQAAMLSIIGESELGLARFTEIAQALGEDAALQARVEAEVMQQVGAAAAAS